MKTVKIIIIGIVIFLISSAHAQVSVSVNVGSPPAWGPAGYANAPYYYLPGVEAFYDVQSSMFIYFEGKNWVRRTYLPPRYKNYDLYGGYKVVINDYHGKTPYIHYKEYKNKYKKDYHGPAQKTIGERPGKGIQKAKMPAKVNPGKKANMGNKKVGDHGNNDMKGGHGNGGGKGKKK